MSRRPLRGRTTLGRLHGLVHAEGLGGFVRDRVSRWARLNRGMPQEPALLGSGRDFPLLALRHGQPLPPLRIPAVPSYPAWLLEGWSRRDRWWGDDALQTAPRVVRQWETLLLRDEGRWRAGVPEAAIRRDLASRLPDFQRRLDLAQALPEPQPRSLGLAESLGWKPDAAVAATVRELLVKRAEALQSAKPGQAEAAECALVADFAKKTSTTPDRDLAWAVFGAAADDNDPRPETIRFLDGLLEARQPQPLFVESLFLRRLARIAGEPTPGGWPVDTVRRALHVVRMGEEAAGRPEPFGWVRGMLDTAAQERHDGEVFLRAGGFVPPGAADASFRRAGDHYEVIQTYRRRIQDARRGLDRALASLPALLPNLDLVPDRGGGLALGRPRSGAGGTSLGPLDGRGPRPAGRRPRPPGRRVEAPDGRPALPVRARGGGGPHQGLHAARMRGRTCIDGSSPSWPPPSSRRRIAPTSGRPGGRSRTGSPRRRTGSTSAPIRPEPTRTAPSLGSTLDPRRRAARLARTSIDLLRLGGLDPADIRRLDEALSRASASRAHAASWPSLAGDLRRAWAVTLPDQLLRSKSWRARPAGPDFPPSEPSATPRRPEDRSDLPPPCRESRALWAWLADRYRYESLDFGGSSLYALASRDCRELAEKVPPGVELRVDVEGGPAALTPERPSAPATVRIELLAAPTRDATVEVDLVGVDAGWLRVVPASADSIERRLVPPGREISSSFTLPASASGAWSLPLKVELQPGADLSGPSPPPGFLVRARVDGRPFSVEVPVSLELGLGPPAHLAQAPTRKHRTIRDRPSACDRSPGGNRSTSTCGTRPIGPAPWAWRSRPAASRSPTAR